MAKHISILGLEIIMIFCLVIFTPAGHTLEYLALEPGADLPVIPGPAGTGITGLYRSMESSNSEVQQVYRRITDDSKKYENSAPPNVLASSNSEPVPGEPEIEIPGPKDSPGDNRPEFKNKSGIVNNRLKIIPEEKPATDLNDGKDNTEILTGLPWDLTPTRRSGYNFQAPRFYRGIYLNNQTIRNEKYYVPLILMAKKRKLNALVVDVQPGMPSEKFVEFARRNDFYIIARVVVFDGGLKKYPPPLRHLKGITDTAEKSAKLGFMEVQLDYIRFADNMNGFNVPLKKRYMLISGILKMVTDRLQPYRIRIGADIFGRIAFNSDDTIGQKLEVFSPHLDTIYPMLYPSHFYGDPEKIKNPYKTVYNGTKNCMRRVGENTRIIAYIQGFKMSAPRSGPGFRDYIVAQVRASEEAGGGGYITWNAKNDYTVFFDALADYHTKLPDG